MEPIRIRLGGKKSSIKPQNVRHMIKRMNGRLKKA